MDIQMVQVAGILVVVVLRKNFDLTPTPLLQGEGLLVSG